jgi:flagellar biogenesis protein FliO
MYDDVRLLVSFLSLILVLAIVSFIYVIFKGKGNYLNKNSKFKEISRYYYGAKTYISILQLDGKLLLLGVTESNINLLGEIDDLIEETEIENSNFADLLNTRLEGNMMSGIKSRLRQMRENDDEENK